MLLFILLPQAIETLQHQSLRETSNFVTVISRMRTPKALATLGNIFNTPLTAAAKRRRCRPAARSVLPVHAAPTLAQRLNRPKSFQPGMPSGLTTLAVHCASASHSRQMCWRQRLRVSGRVRVLLSRMRSSAKPWFLVQARLLQRCVCHSLTSLHNPSAIPRSLRMALLKNPDLIAIRAYQISFLGTFHSNFYLWRQSATEMTLVCYSRTMPSTQVTLSPPIQTMPPSCTTCTRPARPRAVPWLAV